MRHEEIYDTQIDCHVFNVPLFKNLSGQVHFCSTHMSPHGREATIFADEFHEMPRAVNPSSTIVGFVTVQGTQVRFLPFFIVKKETVAE